MHFIKTNVANEADWEQLMENTLAKWGRVDILVNNAGTSYKNKVCTFPPPKYHVLILRSSQQQKSQKMSLTKCSL